jgi:hypothetical protein
MGATNFENYVSKGQFDTPDSAFNAMREEALWEHGHGGYTGTIGEKNGWVMRNDGKPITNKQVRDFIYGVSTDGEDFGDIDENDKFGPAFCVQLCTSEESTEVKGWLFYGYASE